MLGIRLRNGKRLWKHDEDELFGYEWEMLGGPDSKGPLVLEGDGLYAATETGLLVLNAATGTGRKRLREDWRFRHPWEDRSVKTVTFDYPRSMVVGPGGERIYLATREGQVVCRDLKMGTDLWRTRLLKERSAAEKAKDPLRMTKIDLALQGQTLVALGFGDPKIDMAAFSVAGGKVLWRRNSFPKSAWPLCFSIAGDKVVVPGVQWFGFWGKKGDTFVSTFDLQSGKHLRSIRMSGLPGGGSSDGKLAWFRTFSPHAADHFEVVCVDLDSGRRKWLSNGLEVMTPPTLIGTTILVLCKGDMLRCLSSDNGEVLWEMDLSPGQDRWYDHLLVVGNRIVVWGSAYATVLAAAD